MTATDDLDTWAAAYAASLPPMTAAEAASVGQLASVLDKRRRTPRPVALGGRADPSAGGEPRATPAAA